MTTTDHKSPFQIRRRTGTPTIRKPVKHTWLGQAGEEWSSSSGYGNRVVYHRWFEDGPQGHKGEVNVSSIYGDAWRDPDNFREHYRETLQDPTDDEIIAAMERARNAIPTSR